MEPSHGAVVAGGECVRNVRGREHFLARNIALTESGMQHPMFEGKPPTFTAWSAHDDHVTVLPDSPGMTHLARNDFTEIQALASASTPGWKNGVEVRDSLDPHGSVWTVQYHPEYDVKEMAMLTKCRVAPLTRAGFYPDEAAVLAHVEELLDIHESYTELLEAKEREAGVEVGSWNGDEARDGPGPREAPVKVEELSPTARNSAWKMGVDESVLWEGARCCEARNWVHKILLPYAERGN